MFGTLNFLAVSTVWHFELYFIVYFCLLFCRFLTVKASEAWGKKPYLSIIYLSIFLYIYSICLDLESSETAPSGAAVRTTAEMPAK